MEQIERKKTNSNKNALYLEELVTSVGGDDYDSLKHQQSKEGGSDSGVEINGGCVSSLGYVLEEETTNAVVTPTASCDSSLLSCCGDEDETQIADITSEGGGSESSSVGTASTRKRVGIIESVHRSSRPTRAALGSRSAKDRSLSRNSLGASNLTRSQSLKRTQFGDTRKNVSASSTPTTRTERSIKISTDDGRWPSNSRTTSNAKHSPNSTVMSVSFGSTSSPTSSQIYATLPRRIKKGSLENLDNNSSHRTITSSGRDQSLNRTASLRRKKTIETMNSLNSYDQSNYYNREQSKPPSCGNKQQTRSSRTKIYHEKMMQTSLTGEDIESVFTNGNNNSMIDVHSRIEIKNISVQVDRRFELAERLQLELKEMNDEISKLHLERENCERLKSEYEKEKKKNELFQTKIWALLRHKSTDDNILTELEKQFKSRHELCRKQQHEIIKLQEICMNLKKELDNSYMIQKKILLQHQETEAESLEMQEFLQAEKSTMVDSLKDLEKEIKDTKQLLSQKETELSTKQEECLHLVRISEQRRQEKLTLEARLRTVQACSKEVITSQSNSVESAGIALASLGNRLESLVHALVTSYNISDEELEEVIFHNEVYSNNSNDSSPTSEKQNLSSKKLPNSMVDFMTAILKAIWTPNKKILNKREQRKNKISNIYEGNSMRSEEESLNSETEPISLLMSSQHSSPDNKRNSIDSNSMLEYSCSKNITNDDQLSLTNSDSLQNLSDAILQRQKVEEDEELNSLCNDEQFMNVNHNGNILLDQIIEVENLATKLLKVVQIIHSTRDRSDENFDELNHENIVEALQSEIDALKEKIETNSKSTTNISELNKIIEKKEKEKCDVERKLQLTQELLTDNWHKAMLEVRRQYDAIDAALETLSTMENEFDEKPALQKLRQNLEETNFHSASTLPVSISKPDLNANASINMNLTL